MRPACQNKNYVRRAASCRGHNALLRGKIQYYLIGAALVVTKKCIFSKTQAALSFLNMENIL
jgi:hypothetical protein